jgi:hypothetical protein
MNSNKTVAMIAIVAVATLLLATSVNNVAFAHYKKTQTLAQANACGNGPLPLNIFCQNAASQVQGNDNVASVSASQP